MIETAGSLIEQLLPKSIHAVISQGFEGIAYLGQTPDPHFLTALLWVFLVEYGSTPRERIREDHACGQGGQGGAEVGSTTRIAM